MKIWNALLALPLGALLALPQAAWSPRVKPDAPTVVLGTFDSRAVAIAHVRSEAFAAELAEMRREQEEARAAGNEARVAELDELGRAMQDRAHAQGFGTAPVDDVLARVEGRLPALAAEAGVDVLVSKWALAYRAPSARTVDVTERLAAEFGPDEATWKVIRDVLATEPVEGEIATEH